ncbi:MAG: HEAT repeat domain-containing protein, partial [Myxococcota bacterium]
AASSTDPAMRSLLVSLLGDPDPQVAAAAATAVAAPGRDAVVDPLSRALEHESPRVRMAALRGLGRVGTPRALQALQAAAVASPDPTIRRHAQAELRKRASP